MRVWFDSKPSSLIWETTLEKDCTRTEFYLQTLQQHWKFHKLQITSNSSMKYIEYHKNTISIIHLPIWPEASTIANEIPVQWSIKNSAYIPMWHHAPIPLKMEHEWIKILLKAYGRGREGWNDTGHTTSHPSRKYEKIY